jgi:ABC-type xylose transport system permease subunit
MHLPTYLFLMTCAFFYGLVQLFHNWYANKLLFFVSIITIIITLIGAAIQFSNEEEWEWRWMRFYTIPMGLTALGGALGLNEFQNYILSQADISPIPSLIPGASSDYFDAAKNQYISMAFPIAAKLVASIVDFIFPRK